MAYLTWFIKENTTVIDATSGNTGIAEAYLAKELGLPYLAVVSEQIEDVKHNKLKSFGAKTVKANDEFRDQMANEQAEKLGGFYINQFANSEHLEYHESRILLNPVFFCIGSCRFATTTQGYGNDPHESMNVSHETLKQFKDELKINEPPSFYLHTAGTGGTISSIGRYAKKYNLPTKIVLSDTEFSAFYDYVLHGSFINESTKPYWVEPGLHAIGFYLKTNIQYGNSTSLRRDVIDMVYHVPDLASVAAMHFLKTIGINGGTSTGLNFVASLSLAAKQRPYFRAPKKLRIVTILADSSAYYEESYYNKTWIGEHFAVHGGLKTMDCWYGVVEESYKKGLDPLVIGAKCKK